MWLIVGLGNPGREYYWTRHNVGFEVIDKLAYDHNININKLKNRSHIGEGIINNEKVILAKPQTFMNLSGESVLSLTNYYKLPNNKIIIIYDDISLNLGNIRIKTKGSAGGHNGLKNIIFHLNTDEFIRIKIGIGEKPKEWELSTFVLNKFKPVEKEDIIRSITDAGDAIELLLKEESSVVMNKYNKKNH